MEEKEIGKVEHYFGKIQVAAIKITADTLSVGDTIHFEGHTTDFTQAVESMQVEHNEVKTAKAGDNIGMKVENHVRQNDVVYKVIA